MCFLTCFVLHIDVKTAFISNWVGKSSHRSWDSCAAYLFSFLGEHKEFRENIDFFCKTRSGFSSLSLVYDHFMHTVLFLKHPMSFFIGSYCLWVPFPPFWMSGVSCLQYRRELHPQFLGDAKEAAAWPEHISLQGNPWAPAKIDMDAA